MFRNNEVLAQEWIMVRNLGIVTSALMVLAVMAARASAEFIRDDFNNAGTVGTALTGRNPSPTNGPGGSYVTFLGQGGSIVSGQAVVGADSGVAIDISSVNASNVIDVAADLSYNPGSPNAADGAGVGFWAGAPADHGYESFGTIRFRGVALGLNASNQAQLALMQGFTELATISLGSLDVTTLHTLSYEITRSTGAISNLTLDGTPYSFSTNIFTQANTTFVGFGNHGVTGADQAHADNFVVYVPEPVSAALLTVGLATAVFRWRGCGR